jgi:hypothetical protein
MRKLAIFIVATSLVGCNSRSEESASAAAASLSAPPAAAVPSEPRAFTAEIGSPVTAGTSGAINAEPTFLSVGGELSSTQSQVCPQLTWVQDQGNLSVWRANVGVIVEVLVRRNGVVSGTVGHQMRPGDTLSFRINDGSNSDGIVRCTTIPNLR